MGVFTKDNAENGAFGYVGGHSHASYMVLINGETRGFISPTHGIR